MLDLKAYLRIQQQLALGPENRWFAGQYFGHSPTDEECMRYWVACGAAKRFALENYARLLAEKIIAESSRPLGHVT